MVKINRNAAPTTSINGSSYTSNNQPLNAPSTNANLGANTMTAMSAAEFAATLKASAPVVHAAPASLPITATGKPRRAIETILTMNAEISPLNLISSEIVSLGQALAMENNPATLIEAPSDNEIVVRTPSHFTTSDATIGGYYTVRVTKKSTGRFVVEFATMNPTTGKIFWTSHKIMANDRRRGQKALALRSFNFAGTQVMGIVNFNPINPSHTKHTPTLQAEGAVAVAVENETVLMFPGGLTRGIQEVLMLNAEDNMLYKSVQEWNKYTLLFAIRHGEMFATHRTELEVAELINKGDNTEEQQDYQQLQQAKKAEQYAARQSQPQQPQQNPYNGRRTLGRARR